MNDSSALERLNALLPLKQRQDSLPIDLKRIHQQILRSFALESVAPTTEQLAKVLNDGGDLAAALQTLAEKDLIVLNGLGNAVAGAYPMTTEQTPHKVSIDKHSIYAMCALDAVSIAPMFETRVMINSVCHVTGESIQIHQNANGILDAQPSLDVMIGIRWQTPWGHAAHSLCTEMVFLKDKATAGKWQHGDVDYISVLTLDKAIDVGKRFFLPLLED